MVKHRLIGLWRSGLPAITVVPAPFAARATTVHRGADVDEIRPSVQNHWPPTDFRLARKPVLSCGEQCGKARQMLILASQSPTPKALLTGAGLIFDVRPPALDERAVEAEATSSGADARQIALLIAEAKARAVAATEPGAIVVAADQT